MPLHKICLFFKKLISRIKNKIQGDVKKYTPIKLNDIFSESKHNIAAFINVLQKSKILKNCTKIKIEPTCRGAHSYSMQDGFGFVCSEKSFDTNNNRLLGCPDKCNYFEPKWRSKIKNAWACIKDFFIF